MTDHDRIADLEARLAMQSELLAREVSCGCFVSFRCDCGRGLLHQDTRPSVAGGDLRKAWCAWCCQQLDWPTDKPTEQYTCERCKVLAHDAEHTAAFLARVKRQGAAEEGK